MALFHLFIWVHILRNIGSLVKQITPESRPKSFAVRWAGAVTSDKASINKNVVGQRTDRRTASLLCASDINKSSKDRTWSAVPDALLRVLAEKMESELGSGPKGPMSSRTQG